MGDKSVIPGVVPVAAGVFAPGHLGELTQVLDFALVDAVAAETGVVQKRVRLLPTRVVIFFVLGLVLFPGCAYRQVWGKLVAGLQSLALAWPSPSGLARARRRVGPKPFQVLFETIAGAVAWPGTPGVFWRGLRLVALDATSLYLPDAEMVTAGYPKRGGEKVEWGYPLLRLTVLVECGTRALLAAVFGPEKGPQTGEKAYASALMGRLSAGMLLLLDAGYDTGSLLAQAASAGAHYLCRSGAARTPLILRALPDGSYLSVLPTGHGLIEVRVIEAQVTLRYSDGTTHIQQWRMLSSLIDPHRYPAADLLALYHQRWEIETTYFTIKSTILDGRVLRSQWPGGIEQEVWALLTVYQAITRMTADAVTTRPGLDPDRVSFTIALETARDQIVTAAGIQPGCASLVGRIGHAVLANLLPQRRQRIKARSRKLATSKYKTSATKHPHTTMTYTLHTQIMIFEGRLTARTKP